MIILFHFTSMSHFVVLYNITCGLLIKKKLAFSEKNNLCEELIFITNSESHSYCKQEGRLIPSKYSDPPVIKISVVYLINH